MINFKEQDGMLLRNTMTNFKEHDGMLFEMLDKPTPLTPDAEMPCLVRLIQDDSPMGKYNKNLHAFDPKRLTPRICTEVIDVNDLSEPNRGSARCDGFISCQYYHYELIGIHVKKGSDKWALYQMMKGEKVINERWERYPYCTKYLCIDGDMVLFGSKSFCLADYWHYVTIDTGWKIYHEPEQPKTMPVNEFTDLFDAPIGWVCKTRDGGSFPLKYIEVSPTRYAYEDKSGLTVYVMANGRYKKNGTDGRDIISFEPEQPKPESENIIHGYIPADMRPEYFHLCKFKVGDWVEWCGDQYMVESAPPQSGGRYDIRSPYDELGCSVYPENITRKLSPSEVIVRIGCLRGTVGKSCNHAYFLMWHPSPKIDRDFSMIKFVALDTQTRELVEGLLKAQEKECNS